jgi:hypothetical protein
MHGFCGSSTPTRRRSAGVPSFSGTSYANWAFGKSESIASRFPFSNRVAIRYTTGVEVSLGMSRFTSRQTSTGAPCMREHLQRSCRAIITPISRWGHHARQRAGQFQITAAMLDIIRKEPFRGDGGRQRVVEFTWVPGGYRFPPVSLAPSSCACSCDPNPCGQGGQHLGGEF